MEKNVKEEKETLIEKYLRYQRDMMEAENTDMQNFLRYQNKM